MGKRIQVIELAEGVVAPKIEVTLRRRLFYWPSAHLALGRTIWVGHPRGSKRPEPRRIPADAIRLGRGWCYEHWISPGMVRHELKHTIRQLLFGLIRWLWCYLTDSRFRAQEEAISEAAEGDWWPTWKYV